MRKLLVAVLFGFAALAASVGMMVSTAAQEKHDGHAGHFVACAKECHDCSLMCDTCATHCAHMIADGHKEHLTTLQTCQDCSSICASAANVTGRGGPFSDVICTACAEACKRCGDACAKFPADEHMKKCSDACRKCEKACRDMLQHVSGGK